MSQMPQPQPQPEQPQPPSPTRKKRRVGLVIGLTAGAFILLCGGVIIAMSGGGADQNGDGSSPAEEAAPVTGDAEPGTATLGEPVRDGKFEFVVQGVKCGVSSVGDPGLNASAQGQFCLVNLSVKNIGDEAQLLSDSDQQAHDAQGREYQTDSNAGLYANKNADVWLNEINPGNQVKGVLVFDIPKDAKLTKLELHDSAFSDGVEVGI